MHSIHNTTLQKIRGGSLCVCGGGGGNKSFRFVQPGSNRYAVKKKTNSKDVAIFTDKQIYTSRFVLSNVYSRKCSKQVVQPFCNSNIFHSL